MLTVNFINFIRGVEPRDPSLDLVEPVKQQVRIAQNTKTPTTFLLQYDALLDDRFILPLRGLEVHGHEIGAWFEVVQPMCEAAGIPWRGRYPWDWHSHVGFTVGYTQDERRRLTDSFMTLFQQKIGRLPRSVGSWFLDAFTLAYLHERYGVIASCNCKDQVGTDGYTLWGGHFGPAYYPSKLNAFIPAQSADQQIPVPIFRMLGPDPIHQYESGLGGNGQGVITAEPVCTMWHKEQGGGGGDPRWNMWYAFTLSHRPHLPFAYFQAGQENSFGWPNMARGYEHQVALLNVLRKNGQARLETLETTARTFRQKHQITPGSAAVAQVDWQLKAMAAEWYSSSRYRASWFLQDRNLWLRDLRIYDQGYAEPHLESPCTSSACTYDAYPVVDALLWSTPETRAGIRFVEEAPDGSLKPLLISNTRTQVDGSERLQSNWSFEGGGEMRVLHEPDAIRFRCTERKWAMQLAIADPSKLPIVAVEPSKLTMSHNGRTYALRAGPGQFHDPRANQGLLATPAAGAITWTPALA